MSRVVIHRSPRTPVAHGAEPAISANDGYLTKLAKYVPAETIAVVTLAIAVFEITGSGAWLLMLLGAVANIIYLAAAAHGLEASLRPQWYFYLLSAAAFVGWSVATIETVALEVLSAEPGQDIAQEQAFILALTAFLLPAIDTLLSGKKS